MKTIKSIADSFKLAHHNLLKLYEVEYNEERWYMQSIKL